MANTCQNSALAQSDIAPERCPLCGGANDCQLCSRDAYKGSCWCMNTPIPDALLARVPNDARNRACICRSCVQEFSKPKTTAAAAPKILPGDFYFDRGLMVLTASYLSRRGFCCGNGCRHCPYQRPEVAL